MLFHSYNFRATYAFFHNYTQFLSITWPRFEKNSWTVITWDRYYEASTCWPGWWKRYPGFDISANVSPMAYPSGFVNNLSLISVCFSSIISSAFSHFKRYFFWNTFADVNCHFFGLSKHEDNEPVGESITTPWKTAFSFPVIFTPMFTQIFHFINCVFATMFFFG